METLSNHKKVFQVKKGTVTFMSRPIYVLSQLDYPINGQKLKFREGVGFFRARGECWSLVGSSKICSTVVFILQY